MRKKIVTGLIIMAFVCSSLLLVASCAKKQVGVSEGVHPTAAEGGVVKEGQVKEVVVEISEKQANARLVEQMTLFESECIYFDFDKSILKPEAQANLKQKGLFLRGNPTFSVLIGGNCDERGTSEYNLALGQRRADAAKKFLMTLGVPGDRIRTISYGEEKPADPAHNPVAWALNRRDTFSLFQ